MSMINLPAPLYRLYATLDRDKNQKISSEEATNLWKGALTMIDQNKDCSIDIDEVVASLEKLMTPGVVYARYKQGALTGKFNGHRQYQVDFSGATMNMGTLWTE